MKLVIAEKSSVGAEIASVLGAEKNGDGCREGNGYVVSWCVGHLVEPAQPEKYDEKYKRWNVSDLPILPERWRFEVLKNTYKQYKVLKELLNRPDTDEVICATDAGREGECIFRYVYKLAKCQKPVKRLWISSVEHSEIKKGFENLVPDSNYDDLYKAGYARAKADWLVGMNFSRLFSCVHNARLTIGRVQTPTLALIVDREQQIQSFTPQKYYTIVLNCDGFTAESERIDSFSKAKELLTVCSYSDAYITEISKEDKKINPPKLFNLADLQKTANRLFGYTAKQTLDIAQELYEKKLITYPRTDSNYVTSGMVEKIRQLVPIGGDFMSINIFDPNIGAVINDKKVSDHHALLPTINISDAASVSKLLISHSKLLKLICLQLLCAVSSQHTYEQTVLKILCGNIEFTAKGNRVIDTGFKAVQSNGVETITGKPIETKESILPDELAAGLVLEKKCDISDHKTTPPKHFTDASLISAMERAGNEDYEDETAEKKGIGTQATQAGIIEKIIKCGYVERNGKNLVPTDKGMNLIKIVPNEIKSPKMTADWECKLQQIEKGNFSDSDFMRQIERFVSDVVSEYSSGHDETVSFENSVSGIGICPNCGEAVKENSKAFSCCNRECDFVIWKTVSGKTITESTAKFLLENGKTKILKGFKSKKTGKEFSARLKLDADHKLVFDFERK